MDLPNAQARAEILATHVRRLRLDPSVNLQQVAEDPRCEGYSGADLAALLREAGTAALRRLLSQSGTGIDAVRVGRQGMDIPREGEISEAEGEQGCKCLCPCDSFTPAFLFRF